MYLKKKITEEDLDRMRISLSVQSKKLGPEPHCDFCGDPAPIFHYAATQTTAGEDVECWRWAACKDCSMLIDREDFFTIERKIVRWLKTRVGVPDVPDFILHLVAREAMRSFHEFSIRR